ncbi:positive regulator of purine utilization [Diplodia corticola]|uniref:Positive regulator of purine utilization n=1 Tax=Diplodia corticola TaxID=236234 RepID=A0A1J9QMD1_9PEZI|nr:positive regulator of purine utilization [Diplodia corticola]OJD29633.1 positive regulator of purine utilization [Diplodia corticola]
MPPVRTSNSNHRVTKACYRCRHRKSKCDLRFPTCGACQRANVPCVGYDAVERRERPRSDVAYLEDKVAQLEIELRRLRSVQSVDSSKLVDTAISTLTQSLAKTISHPNHHPNRAVSHSSRTPALARHPLVSLHSPLFLSQSPSPPVCVAADPAPSRPENTRCSTIALIPRHVIDIMLKNYTDIYLPQAPYIEETQLHASCERVFAQDGATASHFDIFLVAICLAVSATTLIRHDEGRATAAAEEFWNTAKGHLVYINDEQPWQRLRALLMLTHYGFVNPRAVNLVNTIGAALRLAVHLGLHQELPAQEQAKLDWSTIDIRRKLFWAIYSVDAACHFVLYRAFVFPRNAITAKYPESIFNPQDSAGTEQSPATHIWPLRQYEAEVSAMLSRNSSSSLSPCPLPLEVWRKRAVQRIEEWYAATHTSGNGRPGERIEFRELMYQHNIFRLNCSSIRFPEPTLEMRKNSLNAAIAMASIYARNTRLGKLFYIWHALYQLFDAGVCLLETIMFATRQAAAGEPCCLHGFDAAVLTRTVRTIPHLLRKIALRWPKVLTHAKFLEDHSSVALECLSHRSCGNLQAIRDMDLSAEAVLRRIMVPTEGVLQQQPPDPPAVDPMADLFAPAATPAPQRVTIDSFRDDQLPPILDGINMDEMPSIDTPVDTSWNFELFWNQSPDGAAPSLKSDELTWDFPGVDLDQIFAAFKDGQSL